MSESFEYNSRLFFSSVPVRADPLLFSSVGCDWAFVSEQIDNAYEESKNPKCECGGEKYGGGTHSHWCPKAVSNVG